MSERRRTKTKKRVFREKLIVVSNREPYVFKKGVPEKTVGGLVSALDPVMRSSKGVWIASSSTEKTPRRIPVPPPPEKPSYTMRLVPLSKRDINGYYHGYSNRFLWPLCHITLEQIYLKKSYWTSYKKVNSLFADAVLAEARKKGSLVWLQDYHLALTASYLRKKRPDLRLAIFWHIPWPPYDVFKACPHRREVLEGILANDLVGFQTPRFRRNFLRCVDIELGAGVDVKEGFVNWQGHTTKVRAFPISIDYDWFENSAEKKKSLKFLARFKKQRKLDGKMIGLSVDRLDYTKGIVKCIEALDFFFKKYPRFREEFTFVQIAVPTRKVEPYLSYMELVRKKVAAINDKYSTGDWRPVEYIEGKLTHDELSALYRGSDLILITSVYDGMNLVAKEYVASQIDLNGVLLVSEFAGASEDMPGVIRINPYYAEQCADAMKDALTMKRVQKRKLMRAARAHVSENDIYGWVEDILEELKSIR